MSTEYYCTVDTVDLDFDKMVSLINVNPFVKSVIVAILNYPGLTFRRRVVINYTHLYSFKMDMILQELELDLRNVSITINSNSMTLSRIDVQVKELDENTKIHMFNSTEFDLLNPQDHRYIDKYIIQPQYKKQLKALL